MPKTAIGVSRPLLAHFRTKKARVSAKAGTKPGFGFFRSHARRLFTEFLNLFFNHDWVFRALGVLNGRIKVITSVFLAYPATDEYSDAYTYRFRARSMDWHPEPIGFFWQNGKLGVKFAVSTRDAQFVDAANKEKLAGLVKRMEEIRRLLCAEHKTFAGILPGVIFARRLVRETPEADVTVAVVLQAIAEVKKTEGLGDGTPIIVLGGHGFIGRKVSAALPKGDVYPVDVKNDHGQCGWPAHLRNKPALLVNISLSSVLGQYVDLMWPKMVVLNEVYPEPSNELAERLRGMECRCYHIVGVKAGALPSFPGGYKGGIPCCAAWRSEGLTVLLKRIV